MYPHVCYTFVDGGYVRALALARGLDALNPRKLATGLLESTPVQTWAYDPTKHPNAVLGRVTYYDAIPEGDDGTDLKEYWRRIELLDDVHLGFGALKGLKRQVRQKGVDALIAVDMLVGAFSGLFDIAVLVAGDADFIPVVEELKRRGVMVAVAASPDSLSEDLRRAADRFIELPQGSKWLEPLHDGAKTFKLARQAAPRTP